MLGIGDAFRLHHDAGSLLLVYLHVSGDRFVEVFPGGPPPDPTQNFMHVCLPTDDLDATVEHLRRGDAPIDREPAPDLDGNQMELTQLSEGSSQRRTVRSSRRNGA